MKGSDDRAGDERQPLDLRRIERRIGQLLPGGDPLRLGELYLARVQALVELDEDEETHRQLGALLELTDGLPGSPQQAALVAQGLAWRIRLLLRDEDRAGEALEDLERALEAVEEAQEEFPGLRPLRVELLVHWGHVLVLEDEAEEAVPILLQAADLSEDLEGEQGVLYRVQSRRELGLALAAGGDLEAGLRELDRAKELLERNPAPASERSMLLSARAELLANEGEFDQALRVLAEAGVDDWAMVQTAATLDLAGRQAEAREIGARLLARLRETLDEQDVDSCLALGEVLLMQAGRAPGEDERAALAAELSRLLEPLGRLPIRGRRLLAQALELQAAALEPEEAAALLEQRAHLLEGLSRSTGAAQDEVELIRTWMLSGDALLRLGDTPSARERYGWAISALRAWDDPEHPVVVALLPLGYNAQAQAVAATGSWLAARQLADLAVAAVQPQAPVPVLIDQGEVYLFRAIATVNAGLPELAVEQLAADLEFIGQRLREMVEKDEVAPPLVEAAINLSVLRAEILVDHLDRVDDAAQGYDQALELADLGEERPALRSALLGAKAAMLSERDRPKDALPLLEATVALLQGNGSRDGELQGDLAFALVNLASTLNRIGSPRDALGKIQEADGLLRSADPEGVEGREAHRLRAIRSFLFHQRGEALLGVGHPLLAADEFTRSIDICRELLDDEADGESRHEATHQLPLALLRRARCWVLAGDHGAEATVDLREARRRYSVLYDEEGRPEHRRRLREVARLEQELDGKPGSDEPDAA